MGLGPAPAVPGCIALVTSGVIGTHNWVNKYHINYSGTPPTTPQMNAYVAGANTAWNDGVALSCNVNVTMTKVEAIDLSSETGAVGVLDVTSPGTNDTAYLAANACALIDYDIAVRYRGGHPRTYLPAGSQEDLASSSTWDPDFVTALTTNFQTFLSGIENVTYDGFAFGGQCFVQQLVTVASIDYPTVPAWRVPPVTRIITGFSVNPELASQRRRIGRK
jgi:hypothetical protein